MSDYTQTKELNNFVGFNAFIDSYAYKCFKTKYLSLTYNLNTPTSLVNKGQQLLPKLFQAIKHTHTAKKLLSLSALLYFIYQNENSQISIQGFQDKLFISSSAKFFKAIQNIQRLFQFPNHSKKDMIETNVFGKIVTLSKVVIYPRIMQDIALLDLEDLAQRLAKAIQNKSWFDSTKVSAFTQIDSIGVVSTILSAHYYLAILKDQKTKKKFKKESFRYLTINYEKLEEETGYTYRIISKWTSIVQRKLFDVIKVMPCPPGIIKNPKDVGQVLVEILNFLDLQIEHYFEEKKFQTNEEDLITRKEVIIDSLAQFLKINKISTKIFPWAKFVNFLKEELQKSEDLKDSIIELNQQKKYVSIDAHEIHIEHVEIIFELMTNGASVTELKEVKLSDLVKKYIESKVVAQSSGLTSDDDDDDDIDQYIRTSAEIESLNSVENF